MEILTAVITLITVGCAALFLALGYGGVRCIIRRHKSGESFMATPAAEKEVLFTLLCIVLSALAVWSLL